MSLPMLQKCLRTAMPLCAVWLVIPALFGQIPGAAAPAAKPIISLVHDEAPAIDLVEHSH